MATSESHLLPTLGVALLFAAVFLFGGRAAHGSGRINHRRFLSFAAGVSVAYTFVHVLPALHTIREIQTSSLSKSMVFPEHRRLPVDHGWLPRLLRAREDGQTGAAPQAQEAHGGHQTSRRPSLQ